MVVKGLLKSLKIRGRMCIPVKRRPVVVHQLSTKGSSACLLRVFGIHRTGLGDRVGWRMSLMVIRDYYRIGDGLSHQFILMILDGENNPMVS